MTARCFGCDSLVEAIDGLCPKCGAIIFFRHRTCGAKKSQVKAFLGKVRTGKRLLDNQEE